jgi:glycosyltransferase involved in cell wall biosynthesis
VLKPNGIIRISVPDADKLVSKYVEGSLGDYDYLNVGCRQAETQACKLWALLLENHKAIYDEQALQQLLEKAGFVNITRQGFNVSSNEELGKEIFDTHPNISLTMEAQKPALHVVSTRKDKLRISVISTPYMSTPPRFYGGLEMVVADLCAALTKLGHEVTLFAGKGSKPIGNYEVFETVEPLSDFGTEWSKVNWFEMERKMYLAYKDHLEGFDIIHGHNWWGFEYIAKMNNPKLKVCHTHHGGWLAKTRPLGIEKMNLIAISEFMAKTYTVQGFPAKHVYNGINLEAYPFSANHGDRLVYVGRFVSFKQADVAVKVAQKLGLGLDLIGGAVEQPYFDEKIKPFIDGEKIKLYWKATHEEKVNILQNAKALIFPSKLGEPYGLVAVEAMSCGVPVLTLNDGAIPEVVKEGGVVCDVYDVSFTEKGPVVNVKRDSVEAMVEAFSKLDSIKSEDCRRNAERFSREVMASSYEKLYQQILDGDEW